MTLWKQGHPLFLFLPGFGSLLGSAGIGIGGRAADRPAAVDREREIERLHAKIGQDDRRKERKRPSLNLARRRRPQDRSLRTPELHRSPRTGIAKKKLATLVGQLKGNGESLFFYSFSLFRLFFWFILFAFTERGHDLERGCDGEQTR